MKTKPPARAYWKRLIKDAGAGKDRARSRTKKKTR